MTSEPSRRISSFRRPTALSSLSPRKELLQTSSARRSVLCTAVGRTGRISWSVTGTPREAACQAASEPGQPAADDGDTHEPVAQFYAAVSGKFLGPRVVAVLVVAEELAAVLLGDLLDQVRRVALRARSRQSAGSTARSRSRDSSSSRRTILPRFDLRSTISPPLSASFGHFTPVVLCLTYLHSGYFVHAVNSPKRPCLMTRFALQRGHFSSRI